MNFSNQVLNSSLMILILNQFLRTIYLNIESKYYTQIIVIGLLLLMFFIISFALLRKAQLNSKLIKVTILIFFGITQFEQFYYGIDNTIHCVLAIQFYLEIYFNSAEKSKLSQIIAIFLLLVMILLSSVTLESNSLFTLHNILRLVNQKINLGLFVYFYYFLFLNQNEYKALDQQQQRKSKQLTLDQVLVLQTPINNSMYELSHGVDVNLGQKELFDNINEGVLLAKFVSPDNKISSLSFKFQNAAAQIMFGKDNDELPAFLDTLQCDIQLDSSQSQGMTSSPPKNDKMDYQKKLFVSQSNCGFSLQERRSFSPNSKVGFFQQQNQNQSPDSVLQCKTIYQQILFFAKQKKNSNEEEIQEQIKLQSTFDDNGKQKSIEFIILLGQGKQIFIITRDVIYIKQLKDLLQVNQQKSNMLNYVSHEFRTPLNCIINILQSVQDKVLLNQDQLLKIALESSKHLLNLSNDLLDLAQIKNNVFNLAIRQFNLNQLAEECLSSFLIQAQQQNVQISLKTNSNKTFFINSDRNRIKQILINLIGNALKFTYDGKIDIVLRQYDQFIDIGVKDTGIGISQENIHKLFKAFGKIDNDKSKTMNSHGVGLGLLISNKIAKQLSADFQGIKVQSTEMKYENHGSFFYFTIKLEAHRHKLLSYKPPQKQINHSSPFIPSEGTQKRKSYTYTSIEQRLSNEHIKENKCLHILIVDDNVFNLAVLELMINDYFHSQDHSYQYSIDKANSGTQAIGVAFYTCGEECQGYQIIFMDMEMPGLNGIDASKIILAKNSQLKIIILTGNNLNTQEIGELKKIGIIDYIIKPIQKNQLENIFEQHVIE